MQKTEKKRAGGLMVFYWMLAICGGCNARAAMLAAIWSYCRNGSRAVSVRALALAAGIGHTSALNALQFLRARGLIQTDGEPRKTHRISLTADARRIHEEAETADGGAGFLYVKPWMLETCGGFSTKTGLLAFVWACSQGDSDGCRTTYSKLAQLLKCKKRAAIYAAAELLAAGVIMSPAGAWFIYAGADDSGAVSDAANQTGGNARADALRAGGAKSGTVEMSRGAKSGTVYALASDNEMSRGAKSGTVGVQNPVQYAAKSGTVGVQNPVQNNNNNISHDIFCDTARERAREPEPDTETETNEPEPDTETESIKIDIMTELLNMGYSMIDIFKKVGDMFSGLSPDEAEKKAAEIRMNPDAFCSKLQ